MNDDREPEEPSEEKKLFIGGIVMAVGFALALLAADVIPQRVFQPTVPNWMLLVVGAVLVSAGGSVFLKIGSPASIRAVALSMFLAAFAFLWIAFFGETRNFDGGLPFVSQRFNRILAGMAFGLGALGFGAIGFLAWRSARRASRDEES